MKRKFIKCLFSVILCILLVSTVLPMQVFADTNDACYTGDASALSHGDVFELGLYPQSSVTDGNTVNALNAISCEMKSYGYIKNVNGSSYETIDMSYGDIVYNGTAYRKVSINEYRPLFGSDNEGTSSNKFQSDNGYYKSNTYYFRWEPVRWTVLANEVFNNVLVMSQKLLDAPYYNKLKEATTWESSDLRYWLDNDFKNSAFSQNEQGKLTSYRNLNASSPFDTSIGGGNLTNDMIWIPSVEDEINTQYGFVYNYGIDPDRIAQGTDYAKCQGLQVSSSEQTAGNSIHWLRNPGKKNTDACATYADGSLMGSDTVNVSAIGVRPVFRLDRNATLSGADTSTCRIAHEFAESSRVEPTCTTDGCVNYKCKHCEATKQEPLPALGHEYGEPVWSWADDFSSAQAIFTCTRCHQHNETVEATVTQTEKDGKHRAVATADFNNNTYTDERITDRFAGYSLSLNGSIGINFYINLTEEEFNSGATVDFAWEVDGKEKTSSVTLTEQDKTDNGYRATCPVAVAEMTYDLTATLSINGEFDSADTYSAVQYADTILTDDDFAASYINSENNKGNNGEERLGQLRTMVKTMLDYGAKAQIVFDRNTDNLANAKLTSEDADSPYYYAPEVVTPDMIDTGASDMSLGLDDFGLEYCGSTIVYLSDTSIRHYYKVTDQDKFNAVKDSVTFDGSAVTFTKKNGSIYYELKSIHASDLNTLYTLSIDGAEYKYSALDYVKACLNSDKVSEATKALVSATYLYSRAANDYFGR